MKEEMNIETRKTAVSPSLKRIQKRHKRFQAPLKRFQERQNTLEYFIKENNYRNYIKMTNMMFLIYTKILKKH